MAFIKHTLLSAISICCLLNLTSCVTSPDFPVTPEIEFERFTKTALTQGSVNQDSTFLIFKFQDGDGDIGISENSVERNLIIYDNRTNQIYDQYKTPFIPEEGIGNGVEGTISVLLFTTCCIFPENIPPCEAPDQFPTNEISFDIVLKDRAGNESNRLTTPTLILNCK